MGRRATTVREALPGLARTFRHLWPHVRRQGGLLTTSVGAMLAGIGFRLLEPWPLKFIFDRVIVDAPTADRSGFAWIDRLAPSTTLMIAALAVVLFTALRAVTGYHSTVGFALIGNRVLTDVRGELYRHLQRLSLRFHHRARGGDMVVRVIGDVGMLKEVAVTAVLPLFGNVLILVGMLSVMLVMNWRLALLSLSVLPLFLVLSARLSRRIQAVSRKQRKREGAMAATAAEAIGAIKTVQALSLEDDFAGAFADQNRRSLREGVKAKRLQAGLERSVDVLTAAATALALYGGGRLILTASLTPGDLLVFLSYLKSALKPLKDFAKYTGRLAKASAAGERVLEILELTPEVEDLPHVRPAPRFCGALGFEAVSFAYDDGIPVIKDVSFQLQPGRSLALVGVSGEGKSTLLSLVPRLFDPTSGRVTIDGKDIRLYPLESLRAQIGMVLQDSLLFGLSVYDNIALGVPEATEANVIAAARLALAHEFIQRLPDGYHTLLGERGATLSGGQRQRIAIARAAMRRAPIMLFDEPTAGLDRDNEMGVIEALERLAVGRTTLLVTHDLRLAARADEILYLEDGKVLEQGNHVELMARSGRYTSLYARQNLGVNPGRRHAVGR